MISRDGLSKRRKTVSGPTESATDSRSVEASSSLGPQESSPSSLEDKSHKSITGKVRSTKQRRSISGNILAKFSLGRDGSDHDNDHDQFVVEAKEDGKTAVDMGSNGENVEENDRRRGAMTPSEQPLVQHSIIKGIKTRQRKGSLRKTALLGGRRMVDETLEHKIQTSGRSVGRMTSIVPNESASGGSSDGFFGIESAQAQAATDDTRLDSETARATGLTIVTNDHNSLHEFPPRPSQLTGSSQVSGPARMTNYGSTTDDDDSLSSPNPPFSASATSYFPPAPKLPAPRAHPLRSRPRSPPAHDQVSTASFNTSPSSIIAETSHDYTETEYWGWVILFITWLTFTVGMGSCLEIWSWAWDVGRTPYAPPELEDDPTLPIVGYYPALIILTGVVAWVWITVAWIGMKYFRHAKIEV